MSEKEHREELVVESSADLTSENIVHQEYDTSKNTELVKIPFKKCWELFFSTKAPPKKEKPPFYFWFPPTQTSYEKKIVFKLDCAIMSYVCLSYFVRYLDATNISSAYVSGMKEDLNFQGTDYNWLTQLFGATYAVAGPFTNTAMSKLKPHYFLPCLEIIWGLMCLMIFKAQNFKTVAGLRAVQGFCEGAAWPAIHYILGSWYTQDELAKRTGIYTASGILGVILSGLIQSGLVRNMNGYDGLAGWRWLFIIDAILTFPIAIYGFFIFPDVPNNATARFYLSEEEIQFCRERVKVNGKHRVDRFDKTIFKRVFTSYNWYLFVPVWVIWGYAGTSCTFMGIVLKSLGYNVYDRNNIPTAISGVGIFACLISGFVVDYRKSRWEILVAYSIIFIIGLSIVYAWTVPHATLIAGYILQGISTGMSPVIVSWCNELTKEDDQVRAITIGSLNLVAGLLGIPFNVRLFDTTYAPKFTIGNRACLICGVVLFFYIFVIVQFDRYQNRKRAYIAELNATKICYQEDEESSTSPDEQQKIQI